MMKKFKYVTMMAVALALGFSSCSNDDQEPQTGGIVPNGEKTTAKITLTQAGPSTYATEDPEDATAEESKINEATLLIFDAAQKLESKVSMTVTGGVASQKFETTTGTHYFYAVVNPTTEITGEITGFAVGTALEDVKTTIVNVSAIADIATNDNFLMTNTGEAMPFNVVKADEAEATAGTKNKIEISVGRAVAKVNVTVALSTSGTHFALSSVAYKVNNNPTQMYLMPVIESGQWLTPFYADNVAGTYFKNFKDTDDFFVADNSEPSYAMENSNEVPKQGNATYISVKGVHTPAKVYDKAGVDKGAGSPGADFYRILVDGHYNAKYFNEDPTDGDYINSTEVNGTDKKVVKFENGECFYRLYLADNDQSTAAAKHTIKRNTYYKVTIISVGGIGGNTDGGGTNDKDGNPVNPVAPENPETNPETPITANTYIKATIKIAPWAVVSQSGGI